MNLNNYQIKVLFNGYSKENTNSLNNSTLANCTCTLIKSPELNIIVDTMTAWDGDKLTQALREENINPKQIDYVICTHGHSDHIGCNYLFVNAKHIVGHCISYKNEYFEHDFKSGKEYVINNQIKVLATPGHTLQDVTVIANIDNVVYAITGDLFEREEDLLDDNIWIAAGSDSQELQIVSRQKVLEIADVIIPGHGPMFRNNNRASNSEMKITN